MNLVANKEINWGHYTITKGTPAIWSKDLNLYIIEVSDTQIYLSLDNINDDEWDKDHGFTIEEVDEKQVEEEKLYKIEIKLKTNKTNLLKISKTLENTLNNLLNEHGAKTWH